jgi:N-acetylglucosamine-6-phosphate deacetylase
MLKAVQNCVEQVGIDLAEAINMASLYPAELVSKKTKGRVEAGFDADLIIFNENMKPLQLYCRGII